MDKYTILYIDEDPVEVRQFKRSFRDDFNIFTLDLQSLDLNSVVEILEQKQFDYLIVDYHLNDTINCGYDGNEVLEEFLKRFPHFPAILLTNQDENAVETIKEFDVEKIRSKKEYTESDKLRNSFAGRIKAKVLQYRNDIEKADKDITELIEKKSAGQALSAAEEEELIRLDAFLDEVIDAKSPTVPREVMSSNEAKLVELLGKTDELIANLKKYENVS